MVEEEKITDTKILTTLDILGKYAIKIIRSFGNMSVNDFVKMKNIKYNDIFLKVLNDFYLSYSLEEFNNPNIQLGLGFPTYNHIRYKDIYQIKWANNLLDMDASYGKNPKIRFGLYSKYNISVNGDEVTIISASDDPIVNLEEVLKELKKIIKLFKKSASFYHQLKLIINEDASSKDINNFVKKYKHHPHLLSLTTVFSQTSMKELLINEISKYNQNYSTEYINDDIHFIFNKIKMGNGFTESYLEKKFLTVINDLAPEQSFSEYLNKLFLNNKLKNGLEDKSSDNKRLKI